MDLRTQTSNWGQTRITSTSWERHLRKLSDGAQLQAFLTSDWFRGYDSSEIVRSASEIFAFGIPHWQNVRVHGNVQSLLRERLRRRA